MNDISIRKGETLELTVTNDDPTAYLVKLLVAVDADTPPIIEEIAYFSTDENGVTSAQILSNNTNHPVGDYKYMLTLIYTDDVVENMPDPDCCDDCELPIFTICESISESVS